jgi:hypothetical protein
MSTLELITTKECPKAMDQSWFPTAYPTRSHFNTVSSKAAHHWAAPYKSHPCACQL